jgi:uncharacterized protein DUF268
MRTVLVCSVLKSAKWGRFAYFALTVSFPLRFLCCLLFKPSLLSFVSSTLSDPLRGTPARTVSPAARTEPRPTAPLHALMRSTRTRTRVTAEILRFHVHPIDLDGHAKALSNLVAMLRPGGTLYLSVPFGAERIEYNAHCVFHLGTIRDLIERPLKIIEFSMVDDAEDFYSNADLYAATKLSDRHRFALAIFELRKPEPKAKHPRSAPSKANFPAFSRNSLAVTAFIT